MTRTSDSESPGGPSEGPLAARLARLRGRGEPPRALAARTLAALAANPGCHRRAVLDAAGVDKAAIAEHLGEPAPFGQSPFAIARGIRFEARVKEDGYRGLLELLRAHAGLDVADDQVRVPDVSAPTTADRAEATRRALAEAAATGGWTLLDHPMLVMDVSGSPAHLEPDAVVVRPDGRWTVVEVKSFPMLDGSADPGQVGAAARQAAVYVLALRGEAARLSPTAGAHGAAPTARADDRVLLVCPKDFSQQPAAAWLDVRKQVAVVRRQLERSVRIGELVAAVPEDVTFDLEWTGSGRVRTPTRDPGQLRLAVEAVDATYSPDCLSTCELAFHCRSRARSCGELGMLGRGVRGELGGFRTADQVRAALDGHPPASEHTEHPDRAEHADHSDHAIRAEAADAPSAPARPHPEPHPEPGAAVTPDASTPGAEEAAARLRRAAELRAEALAVASGRTPAPDRSPGAAPWA